MEYVPQIDERQVYRAVTSGAYNMLQPDGSIIKGTGGGSSGESFPYKGTVPIAKSYEGLITSTGKNVRIDADGDFNLLKKGDFLYDGNVLRQIDVVLDRELLVLTQAFPSDLDDAPLLVCERQFFRFIEAKSTHASAAAVLLEAPFKAGDTFKNDGTPISYDASIGEISFTCRK